MTYEETMRTHGMSGMKKRLRGDLLALCSLLKRGAQGKVTVAVPC